MKKKMIAALAGVGMVIGAALLFTGCHHRSPEEFSEKAVQKLSEKLSLDQGQKDQLKAISAELLAKAKELRQQRETIRATFQRQLQSDRIDTSSLKEIVRAKRADMDSLIDLSIDRFAAFHATLSPEQRTRLSELVNEWASKGPRRCGHGPLGGWGDDHN